MQTATLVSNGFATQSWINARRIRIVVLLLTMACVPQQEASAQEILDQGDFELDILDGANDKQSSVARILIENGELEAMLDDLNTEINLQQDVSITFASWSKIDSMVTHDLANLEPNAFYDRGASENIFISYELIVKVVNLFGGDANAWHPNVIQTVLHEIGHALIDVNEIPPPPEGDSEIVADQLAFFIMSEFYEDTAALDLVAEHYESRAGSSNELAAASEHLSDDQRAKAYLCWINGRIQELADEPGECRSQYEVLVDDWDDRLAPSWKDPFEFESVELE